MITDSFEVLDWRFRALVHGNVHVEKVASGMRWAEGPAWFAAGRYFVWSDIPNDRMMRWDETDGSVSVFRHPAGNSNGNTVDGQGRLVTCEHRTRTVTRTEHDGSRTVLASHFQGHRLNSLGVVHRSGAEADLAAGRVGGGEAIYAELRASIKRMERVVALAPTRTAATE